MKSFYTACAILLMLLTAVTVISSNTAKELESFYTAISGLPATPPSRPGDRTQTPEHLLHKWERVKSFLSLTTHRAEIMRAEPELYNINVYFHSDTIAEYKAARERLLCVVRALLDTEQLWWRNIF
ncbi:MAG: hypothetical protein E7588_03725 [Ruminococcaceae bacterium]|nr:hypothetical protein [Oscillospiraceae bacterium]